MIPLIDPKNPTETLLQDGDELVSHSGNRYPIIRGIPRFLTNENASQEQTSESFGYKWNRQPNWGFEDAHQPVVWQIWKDYFGWDGPQALRELMQDKVVLDAGCGAGSSLLQFVQWPQEVAAVDISSAIDACKSNFEDQKNCQFFQADLQALPFPEQVFDVVWSNGVLHHTPNTFESLQSITQHAKQGGLVIFYIYVKKAPIREFVDDYLRESLSERLPEVAWQRMEILTRMGQKLSELNVQLTLDEDFEELGFKKGTYDLQRFMYYTMFKCFWNPGLSFDDNVHVNYDWYHPKFAHRHSPEEVHGWLEKLSLKPQLFKESDSGIAVIAQRN